MDSKTIKLKSNSPVFRKFVTDLDAILSKVYAKDVQGNPIKDTDAIFVDARDRIQNLELNFKNGYPITPFNVWVAQDLIKDEIDSLNDEDEVRNHGQR